MIPTVRLSTYGALTITFNNNNDDDDDDDDDK